MPHNPKTVTVPLTKLDPSVQQPQVFGPFVMPNNATSADMVLDRTISGGMNAQPTTTSVQIFWYVSEANGPFVFAGGGTFYGGIEIDPDTGQPITTMEMEVSSIPGGSGHTGTQVKIEATTVGTAVEVSGTVTLSFE